MATVHVYDHNESITHVLVKVYFVLQNSGEKPETMTTKDAAMFPLIASGTLLGIYIVFKVLTCCAVVKKSVYIILIYFTFRFVQD